MGLRWSGSQVVTDEAASSSPSPSLLETDKPARGRVARVKRQV